MINANSNHSSSGPHRVSKSHDSLHSSPHYDLLIQQIADYVTGPSPSSFSSSALHTARLALMDSMACLLLGLQHPQCRHLIAPPHLVTSSSSSSSSSSCLPPLRVPGTDWRTASPSDNAFMIGTAIRWLDFNDTWLAAEWGHPSDNFAGIIAMCQYVNHCQQVLRAQGKSNALENENHTLLLPGELQVKDILLAAIQAYEIQGTLSLRNCLNARGLDHVAWLKIASTAVLARLCGLDREGIMAATSHAFMDGHPLRTYRHAPNTVSRKCWAAGDAVQRAVLLVLRVARGEDGCGGAVEASRYGFADGLFGGEVPSISSAEARNMGCYIMENVLFKVKYPAEFHGQTAVEAGVLLHGRYGRDQIERCKEIRIRTHEAAMRIINKGGSVPLQNFSDRDHSLQYMLAVALLKGTLSEDDYTDEGAELLGPHLERLRRKMHMEERKEYSKDYLDPKKRAFTNSVQIIFEDGEGDAAGDSKGERQRQHASNSPEVVVEFPLGHARRRDQAIPSLKVKYQRAVSSFICSLSPNKKSSDSHLRVNNNSNARKSFIYGVHDCSGAGYQSSAVSDVAHDLIHTHHRPTQSRGGAEDSLREKEKSMMNLYTIMEASSESSAAFDEIPLTKFMDVFCF
eukprot:Nk52_evm7s309 gene=Nk52_evmTU7s309